MRILKEANTDQHIYIDSKTGDTYIYNGTSLVKLGKSKTPEIGDKGDEDIQAKEEEERQKQIDAEGGDSESEEELKDRLARIERNFKDETGEVGRDLRDEDEDNRYKEYKKAKQKEAQKYKSNPSNKFKLDLQRFIARQISDLRDRSWKKFDKNASAFGIMKPGWTNTQNGKIPVINVYYDQSGSWSEDDIKVGNSMIAVLGDFEKKRQIQVNTFYFANTVQTDAQKARREGGTGAGPKILQHIQQTKPDNVVIMTDSDFDNYGNSTNLTTVPGAAWFLWKNGQQSFWLKDNLKGKMETRSYNI